MGRKSKEKEKGGAGEVLDARSRPTVVLDWSRVAEGGEQVVRRMLELVSWSPERTRSRTRGAHPAMAALSLSLSLCDFACRALVPRSHFFLPAAAAFSPARQFLPPLAAGPRAPISLAARCWFPLSPALLVAHGVLFRIWQAKSRHMDDTRIWRTPQTKRIARLDATLSDRATPLYSDEIATP